MAANTSAQPQLVAAGPGASGMVASLGSGLASIAACFPAGLLDSLRDGLATLAARLTVGRIAAAVAAFLVAAFLADCALKPRYPRSLPRVGYGDSVLATMRNWLGYVFYFNDWVDEGYNKYSKHGRAFVVPSAASRPQEIVVPRSQTAWMLDLPDHVLSVHAAHDEVLYTAYNFVFDAHAHTRAHARAHGGNHATTNGKPPPPVDEDFHSRVVHRNLARHLPGLLPAIEDEVALAVDAAFGGGGGGGDGDAGEEWRTVKLWDAWLAMVPQITNLLLAGPDACRNRPLLDTLVRFADAVVTNSFLLNMFPKLLHPLVGRLASIPNRRLWRRIHAHLEPIIRERLRLLQPSSSSAQEQAEAPHEDYITWHVRMALAEGRAAELDPVAVSKRLLHVEFAAIHTTVITGFFVMIDLLTSDPARGFVDGIRQEVADVRRQQKQGEAPQAREGRQQGDPEHWTKPALARLWRTDSAIRESMRVSNFATSLVKRKVVAPQGVTNAAEGWHAPCGGLLMLDLAGTHHDPDLYPDPDAYDAFRYARQREAYEAEAAAAAAAEDTEAKDRDRIAADAMRGLRLGMVTTSDSHLAFGHGRHACPGRFFVAHELKMILAYLLTNYEIKPLAARPKTVWVGQTIIPPLDVKVEVRRRKN